LLSCGGWALGAAEIGCFRTCGGGGGGGDGTGVDCVVVSLSLVMRRSLVLVCIWTRVCIERLNVKILRVAELGARRYGATTWAAV